jgi:NhaA family Na+:H+ antiporter
LTQLLQVNFVVLPIYIVAKSSGELISGSFEISSQLGNSIVISRVMGKLLGITFFAFVAINIFKLPSRLFIAEIAGGGALAGMGLAVSIMICKFNF